MNIEKRFNAKVERIPGIDCWVWIGSLINCGYGSMNCRNEIGETLAHRISWILHMGSLSKDDHVLHRCDIPCCVNPGHLFLGTHADNMLDMAKKLRSGRGKLTPEAIRSIRDQRSAGVLLRVIAATHGVSEATISRAARSVIWGYV